jgi:hypothetical protein
MIYYYYWNNKKHKLNLKDKINNHKNFDKRIGKNKKSKEKQKGPNWILYYSYCKNNQKPEMRDKIETIKLWQKSKEKKKESKVEGPNWKTYTYKLELKD